MEGFRTTLLAIVTTFAFTGLVHAQAGLDDLEVAHAAYTADVIDIEYAKIALAKSANAEVKTFAELMIRDHTATSDGAGWDTGSIKANESGQFIAKSPGSFAYHCAFHPGMKGTITVVGP